ncbi:hypothetical protein BKH41_02710 [Helicobacter sp. 12S02232-10]|uniref:hypothetical protein n=1 Tax=Helicobacter sp. 12S02232-10 TaxID=1476197 RepID=UPI000BA5C050|nr:hypothetical protein [Helicobacter sp. 12S02232-10]PAF49593.1 hypothetical protein BKH41_02710 [Helicobacter sp. 12S02232-10]
MIVDAKVEVTLEDVLEEEDYYFQDALEILCNHYDREDVLKLVALKEDRSLEAIAGELNELINEVLILHTKAKEIVLKNLDFEKFKAFSSVFEGLKESSQ